VVKFSGDGTEIATTKEEVSEWSGEWQGEIIYHIKQKDSEKGLWASKLDCDVVGILCQA